MQIKKLLDSQPTISFGTFRQHKIVVSNKKFNNFFNIKREDVEKEKVDSRDVLSFINDSWLDNMLTHPETPYKIHLHKYGKDYVFDVYLSITYINENCLYIYSMLDITELEKLKRVEFNHTQMASIGKLSLGLTHEINTPLTFIKGGLELIEMEIESCSLSQDQQDFIDSNMFAVKNGVERIETIVELLKEYSASSVETKNPEGVNIAEVIHDVHQLIYNRSKFISNIYLNEEKLILEKIPQKTCSSGNIGKQKLGQVLIVLLNNSLDELTRSKLPFEERFIKIKTQKYENGKTAISVIDNGGGIREDIFKRLFEPFVSGKHQCGIGLGLNIAKKIIEDRGGKITAFNIDDGAVFRIEI